MRETMDNVLTAPELGTAWSLTATQNQVCVRPVIPLIQPGVGTH